MKPKYNTSKFRNQTVGASLVTAISICFGGSAFATTWDGTTSQAWNDLTNWVGDNGTAGSNGIINTSTGNFPIISADFIAATTPVDIMVGEGAGISGRVDHTAGTASTGTNNWMFVGRNGGTGVYNLTGGAAGSGTHTLQSQGAGSLNAGGTGVGGRLYIGGSLGTGSTGTFNMNTTGTLNARNQIEIGTNTSQGTLNLDSGTINAGTAGGDGDWFEIGNGGGSTGTLNMSGGTINKSGTEHFIVGANGATGFMYMSGGALNVNNEIWVGNNGGSNGTLELSAGTITNSSWVAIGRNGAASGTVKMTGGKWVKNGGGVFIVGASAPGTMELSGGEVDVQGAGGLTWIGELAGATTATLSISGDNTLFSSAIISVGPAAPNAILNLAGGTVKTRRFTGQRVDGGSTTESGTGTINFEGTQIIATASATDFMANIDVARTNTADGLRVDSAGFNLVATQVISGGGGLVKSGNGSLTLNGANTYSGATVVNAGRLVTTTTPTGGGDLTVSTGATFGLNVTVNNGQLVTNNVTLEAGATLDFNLGGFSNNATNAPLGVKEFGSLVLNGPVTVNVTDALPVAGKLLLLKYTPGTRSGSGSFVLGTEPLGVNLATPGVVTEDPVTGEVYLDVASVALPRWQGNVSAIWDTATANWYDQISNLATTYTDGSPVVFNDAATGPNFNVDLNITVLPDLVTFNNSSIDYSLTSTTGTGKISGATGFVKSGTGTTTLSPPLFNDYTGPTSILGGRLTISTITNAGVPSAIGAPATTDPSSLVISGGNLNYIGGSTISNRGFTIGAADSTITIPTGNTLELSGAVASTAGSFVKQGGGNLVLSNTGTNVIGGTGQTNRVVSGGLTFQGSGTQTVSIPGALHVGTGGNAALVINNSAVTAGATEIAIGDNEVSTLTVSGTGSFLPSNFITARGLNSEATILVRDSAIFNKTGGYLSLGVTNNGKTTMTVQDSAQVITNGDFNVADTGSAVSILNISGSGSVTHSGPFYVAKNGGTDGTVNVTGGTLTMGGNNEVFIGTRASGVLNQSAGVVNSSGWTVVGRYNVTTPGGIQLAQGQLNVSGGTFNQVQVDRGLIIGEEGTGSLTVSNTGVVNAAWNNGIVVGNGGSGIGTINLDAGGTIITKSVHEGSGGSSALNFDGGQLIAATGASAVFLALDVVTIEDGGAIIDTNGNDVSANAAFGDGGSGGILTKIGAGALYMNSFNGYTGTTQVTAGTLGGTGFIAGAVVISGGANLNPGATSGTLSVGSVTFAPTATLTIDITAQPDTLKANFGGNLNLSNATLVLNGTPTQAVYVIADYTDATLTGTFASVPALPAGYTLDYNYAGGTQVAITRPANTFELWAVTNITAIDPNADATPGGDPDADGLTNSVEFALNGNPLSGASSGKVVSKVANVGGVPSLVLTLPVRTGATFSGTPQLGSNLVDGVVYTLQGSFTLADLDLAVSEVLGADKTAIELPLVTSNPTDAGWTYRTFTTGPVSAAPRAFVRAVIEQP